MSRWDCSEFLRRNLVSFERLTHIPNCADAAFFTAQPMRMRGTLGLPTAGPLIVFVGGLTDQKGVEDLIRAVPHIRATHTDAHVVVVGDGPLRSQLEAMARGVAAQAVIFTGALEDPLPVLQVADVVVVPSRNLYRQLLEDA